MDKNVLIIWFYRAIGALRGFRDFYFSSNKCEICILLSYFNKKSLDKGQFIDLKGVSNLYLDQELVLRWICSFPIYALVCILQQF